MELTYSALVLLVQTSFVISTPYGYGPRTGGASAKAEANAFGGGTGALPVDIPTGAGYSGSFSKSSASSFASSSASSSASASSFSYSGSGAGGSPIGGESNPGCGSGSCKFGVKGGNQGLSGSGSGTSSASNAASVTGLGGAGIGSSYNNGGSLNEPKTSECGSGNCQSSETGSHGSTKSPNEYSNSYSLSSTGSYNLPTPKCEGSNCENTFNSDAKCTSGQCAPGGNSGAGANSNVKCSSGNCAPTPQFGSSSTYGNDDKCTSGQCGSKPHSGSASNDYDLNDIHVPASSGISNAETNYDSNVQNPGTNAISGCKYGNCAASPASNPTSYTPEYPPCSSPNCNDYGLNPTSAPANQGYSNKPDVHLTTPKQNSECTTPNCQPVSAHSKLPSVNGYSSGYGAQNQNIFTNPSTSPCADGNCNFGHTKGPYSTNLINSDSQPLIPSSPSNCASGNCNTYPSTQGPSDYGGTPGSKPYHVISTQSPLKPYEHSCVPGSPNCNAGVTPSYKPSCAPGSPNCNVGSVTPSFVPNCAPGTPSCIPGAVMPSFGSSCAPGSPGCTPTRVTPSFGPSCTPGTPGCTPGEVTHSFGSNCVPGSPGCSPAVVTPFGPGCSPGSPGCNPGVTPSFGPSCAPGSPSCNVGTVIPGYAKPTQGLMPPFPPSGAGNIFSGSTSIGSSHYSGGSYAPRPYGGSYGSRPSGSFGSSPSHSSMPALFPQSQSGNYYSVAGSLPSSPHAPTGYQSGHTDSDTVISTPTIPPYNIPSSGFPSVSTGTGQNGIATPTYIAPTGETCNTPNCGGSGTENIGGVAGANTQSKPVGATSSSGELPSYTGGFGGPSGILKPNEYKAPAAPYEPATSYTPDKSNPQDAPCATGNCGPHASPSYGNGGSNLEAQPGAATGANIGFGGPAGILKPNEFTVPSSTYNKPATPSGSIAACATGHCGLDAPSHSHVHEGSGSQSTASASASANAVYTGGFGGPPGFLKPYDGGKSEPSTVKSQGGHYGSHHGTAGSGTPSAYSNNGGLGSQLNGGNQGSSVAQANAVASASSGANAVSGYNHGGHKPAGAGGCGGGCGAVGGESYGNEANFGLNSGLSHSKSGGLDGGVNAAGANARSLAGAVGGTGAFGSSYASSSASAHATSGAAVKGSYGKR